MQETYKLKVFLVTGQGQCGADVELRPPVTDPTLMQKLAHDAEELIRITFSPLRGSRHTTVTTSSEQDYTRLRILGIHTPGCQSEDMDAWHNFNLRGGVAERMGTVIMKAGHNCRTENMEQMNQIFKTGGLGTQAASR